jgi:hypothetical protein
LDIERGGVAGGSEIIYDCLGSKDKTVSDSTDSNEYSDGITSGFSNKHTSRYLFATAKMGDRHKKG